MKALKWIVLVLVVIALIALIIPSGETTTEQKQNTETTTEDIEILSMSETVNEVTSIVHVEVKNNTSKLLKGGQIKVIYEDENKKIVGVGNGTIINLASGATKVVDCVSMDVEGAKTFRAEVTPMFYE